MEKRSSPDAERLRELTHELNNLLGVVITYAELARESLPANHPAEADMVEIGRAAQQAVALVDALVPRD